KVSKMGGLQVIPQLGGVKICVLCPVQLFSSTKAASKTEGLPLTWAQLYCQLSWVVSIPMALTLSTKPGGKEDSVVPVTVSAHPPPPVLNPKSHSVTAPTEFPR